MKFKNNFTILDPAEDRYVPAMKMSSGKFFKILDVGCGPKRIKKHISGNVVYKGVDAKDGEDIIGVDLEKGLLPLKDNEYDSVFCLDVLEHLDNPVPLVKEILRVSKNEIIISLPNMYHWMFRLKYLFFGSLPQNIYGFSNSKAIDLDRHKWVTSYKDSINFIKENFQGYPVSIGLYIFRHNRFKFMKIIDKFMVKFFPAMFSYTVFFRINKKYD